MSWIGKILPGGIRTERKKKDESKKGVPEGLWEKCPDCESILYRPELEKNLMVCPQCDHHLRIKARQRLAWFLDAENQHEIAAHITPIDVLRFKDTKPYKDRLSAAQHKTKETDALIVIEGTLKGYPLVASAFEFDFLGGSMGSVVG